MITHVSLRSVFWCCVWIALLSMGGCTATQRQEAKTVICKVCAKVEEYCHNGAPLSDAQKREIVQELYPDGGR